MKRLLSLVGAVIIAGCATSPSPRHALQPNTAPGSARVILVSFDGVGADAMAAMRSSGAVGSNGYQYIIDHGLSARVVPVNPTLTASTHVSMATGAPPEVHGIVSNSFRTPGTPVTQWTSGYSADIDAETLWEAAKRQGKKVGVILFAGADGRDARRSADWGLTWSSPLGRSRLQTLRRSDFAAEWVPPGWSSPRSGSFSPILHARTEWSFPLSGSEVMREVVFTAIDTTNDGRENYDRIDVRSNRSTVPVQDGWFAVSTETEDKGEQYLVGSWSKIVEFDDQLTSVTIYWGAAARNEGYPSSYRRTIDQQIGFWPSPPDERMASDWLSGKGGLPPEVFIEQVNRLSSFIDRVTLFSMKNMPWDLLMAYHPIIDEAEHQFHIENARQAAYSPTNMEAGRRVRAAAYTAMDRSVQHLLSSADLANTAVAVTGDHGHEALDTQIAMNRLLADWGYAKVVNDQIAPDTHWGAITSGHIAHIYYLGSAEVDANDLVNRLRELKTPEGDAVFERVVEAGPNAHPNSGRIVATAYPRFYMSGSSRAPVISKTSHYGQHGGLNVHASFHTVFAAVGPRVTPGQAGTIEQTEIARYISSILGIQPPANAR